ncbi:cilia- and flagella-associated protein 91 isoform X1 [Electrophorus electricus]|uniref:cilia- and flagella-associated protein 91 isoform X1 n=1 Tax=Electrophorus electricus TaxID=8005 RepID=UPI0015CFF6BC|nr:cilia- and flagella-associated protein 91 isoform X1 [Electrophorus electricus]
MNVSVTRTFHEKNEGNKGFRQQRAYDYLYDPTFTVSGEIDHTRLSHKALSSVDRVRKYPEFNSMFSNLPHHPHYTLRLDATDPVPNFIDRRWRGLSEQRRETLQKLSGLLPGVQLRKPYPEDVTGVDRWKFFKRPLIPFSKQIPPDVVFALPKTDPLSNQEGGAEHPDSPFQRTVGVQTDYRDSEAQTEPYSPEYTLHPGTAPPELLTLASLMWGRGLPAGLEEVEMIERARKKRAWETTLPPLNDLNQLEQRKRMMDEMERKEWAFREQEIEKLQEARLDLLMQLLQQREVQQEEATVGQLDEYFAQRQRQKEDRLHKIRSDYVLSVRKLLAKRRAVDVKRGKRDVISEHSDYGSQTYAPLSRHGVFPDRHTARSTVTSRLLSTYQGLLELETSLPASALEPRIKAPKPRASKGFLSRSERREMELMRMHQALKDTKVRAEEKKPLRFLYKKEKPVPRPSTPVVDVPLESEEKKELAVIYLQKLLRGRSIQNQMLEGRAKRLELIQELRTTHALQREEQELQRADKQVTLALQRERELHSTKISQIDAYMAGLSGAVLVDMLDFLAKELVRLQEERRIHAFTLLAERDRRIREAEESGRRQVEERRRREEDEIFKQVVKVHQATVDLYLEDVIIRTIEHTAEDQAREEIHHMAQELDAIAHAMEQPRDSVQSEEIVAELVYRFLIPEVHKITVRDRVRQSQRRHLHAAHSLIHNTNGSAVGSPVQCLHPPSPSARVSVSLLSQMLDQVEEAGAPAETPARNSFG